MFTILVADDERSMTEFLEIMLKKEGYDVVVASTAEDAITAVNDNPIDLVITDIKFPVAGGMAVLKRSLALNPDVPVIMVTAYASADTAVEAMKLGAYDYITKPFKIDEMKLVVAKALERRSDKAELKRLKEALDHSYNMGELLGKSEKMKQLFTMIRKIADSRATVLITGESGTGKEMVARTIHRLSNRRDKPFHSINCGAMPEQLLESELFGHQKGSFTSAHSDKKGILEHADGGTFFMDEVGEAAPTTQVKMLRVLQEREFRRVGGVKDIHVDIRVIAATNHNLEELIKDGRFREDFFYRLNVIAIHLPPLRERRDDIPLLATRFLAKYSEASNQRVDSISNDAMRLLERYRWRGNVRELENAIERAVALATGPVIEPDSLPDQIRFASAIEGEETLEIPEGGIDLDALVSDMEKDLLKKALDKSGGKKKEAAKLLNLTFRSFRYKLAKYAVADKSKDDLPDELPDHA